MTRILVVTYSQSGAVSSAARAFVTPLQAAPEVEIIWEVLRPLTPYPYPWNSLYRFFDLFPECINEEPPPIAPLSIAPAARFDLVILAYQVWFLAPSLPFQAFLQSEYAQVLHDTRVITLVVCRGMWHSASERMKVLIAAAGGVHIDNVVVTHQGEMLATFITTPRLLFTGKKDRMLGMLPEAGTRDEEVEDLARFGQALRQQLDALAAAEKRPLLRGLDAVNVNRRYVLLERLGRFSYGHWAWAIRKFGPQGSRARWPILTLFMLYLVLLLPGTIGLTILLQFLLQPILRPRIDAYVAQLKLPSGVM